MVRALVSGDPHLKVSSLESGQVFLDELLALEASFKPDFVVVLGDLFDTFSVLRVEVLNRWAAWAKRVDPKIPHFLLVGNHDRPGSGSKDHALVGLDRFPGIVVVDRPLAADGMGFMPWCQTYAEFEDGLKAIPVSVESLWMHNTFLGAQYENGFYDPDAFPLERLERFRNVVGGHVHKEQYVDNVYYVGSPYSFGFQDAGEWKGLHTVEGSELNEWSEWTKISLSLPSYWVVSFRSPEEFLRDFEGWRLLDKPDPQPRDRFKVIVKGDRASLTAMSQDQRYLDLKNRFKLTVVPEYEVVPRQPGLMSQALSAEALLETYVNKVLSTSLDRSRLLKMAKEVLQGVTRG